MSLNERTKESERIRSANYIQKLINKAVKEDSLTDVQQLKKILQIINHKKYGIVWEEHTEEVEQELAQKVVVFKEEKEKELDNAKHDHFDFLIEGDNYRTLRLLQKTHDKRVDLIYIDPPYNTGHKDFKYDDNYVDGTDEFKHSKWLSFMERRLQIAKKLLKTDGVLFISIDNNEYANLKLLMDEILPDGYVTTIHVEMSAVQGMKVGSAKQGNIVKNGEYLLVYSRDGHKNVMKHPLYDATTYDSHYSIYLNKIGDYYEEIPLIKKLTNDKNIYEELKGMKLVNDSGHLTNKELPKYYDLSDLTRKFINDHAENIVRTHTSVEVSDKLKEKMKVGMVYKYQKTKREYLIQLNRNGKVNQKIKLSDKIGWSDGFLPSYGPRNIRGDWWSDFYLDMGNVNKEGGNGVKLSNGKKPVRLIKQIIMATTNKDAVIMDFFAGSGTTGEAVLQQNKEDGGNRSFILATNSEVADVTYRRMQNLISQYHFCLKYFTTDLVDNNDDLLEKNLLLNIYPLIELATGLDIKDKSISIIFNNSDFYDFKLNDSSPEYVFIRSVIYDLLSNSDKEWLNNKQSKLVYIPEEYFAKELNGGY